MKMLFACGLFVAVFGGAALPAHGRPMSAGPYDGAWHLSFNTLSGPCDTYDFDINIVKGIIGHPNLVRFRGAVSARGVARASVSVQDKSASGSGRLTRGNGRGTWTGRSGTGRCGGIWTAARN